MFVVAVGLIRLLDDSELQRTLESWISVHALFGLLLAALVAGRFHRRVKHSWPMLPIDIRHFSRQSSRLVYLSLYVMVAAKQLTGVVSTTGFQICLVDGLLALVMIRVLAAICRHAANPIARLPGMRTVQPRQVRRLK